MVVGIEYILDNKKPRVYSSGQVMYFLLKDNKVVYIGFGNILNPVMHQNKDYDSYCTIKNDFKDNERMEVFKYHWKLYKPKYNLENLPNIQWGKWGLKCNDDNLEDIEIYPTYWINGQPVED